MSIFSFKASIASVNVSRSSSNELSVAITSTFSDSICSEEFSVSSSEISFNLSVISSIASFIESSSTITSTLDDNTLRISRIFFL